MAVQLLAVRLLVPWLAHQVSLGLWAACGTVYIRTCVCTFTTMEIHPVPGPENGRYRAKRESISQGEEEKKRKKKKRKGGGGGGHHAPWSISFSNTHQWSKPEYLLDILLLYFSFIQWIEVVHCPLFRRAPFCGFCFFLVVLTLVIPWIPAY